MDEILTRAFAAYFRSDTDKDQPQPSSGLSDIETINGLQYAVLRNVNGILKVYRVRNDGRLKGLKRWPTELEEVA